MSDQPRNVSLLIVAVCGVALAIILGAYRVTGDRSKAPAGTARLQNSAPKNRVDQPLVSPVVSVEETLNHALAEFQSEADAIRRDELLNQWIDTVDYQHIPELIEILGREPRSKFNSEITQRLLRKWAGNDPAAAARFAAMNQSPDRALLLSSVASVWATLNINDAIAWARELPEKDRPDVIFKIAQEAVGADPRQALELARELPGGDRRNDFVAQVASEWALRSPDDIAAWAGRIEDADLRQHVVSHIAMSWGDTNPAKAAELAITQLPPGRAQNDAVVAIVQRWVQKQPTEASAWVASFPEGSVREMAARELVGLWTDQNSSSAGEWVKGLPPGQSKDSAMDAYVSKITVADPAAAARWAAGIDDENLRARQMEKVAEIWLEKDASAARKWLDSSPLASEVKERLLTPASR